VDLADLTRDLEGLRDEALAAIAAAADVATLESIELDVLGKKGRLTSVLRGIGALPAEDRPRVGAVANVVREAIEAALAARGTDLRGAALALRLRAEAVDVTTPGRPIRRGALHPIVETIGEIASIFEQFGFVVYEGPEVEDDLTNFQMLNIPPDHPARDLWDTLYVDVEDRLLRTHTSPGQIRVMQSTAPPIRALLPGRCYRYEAIDASHASEFFQVEGLMVDEDTTMADLKGLLDQFAKAMYGHDKRTRFRPGYYPFTEPSVAFDVECLVCGGSGCPAGSRTGWMTILGAGMVHPVVLQYGGLDPERYQGFAFGMGVERIANLRHSVGDLRLYMENDLAFLHQFESSGGWLATPRGSSARRAQPPTSESDPQLSAEDAGS
jgi:phenylalanyl-tRNA synthetase alpha chain